MFDYIKKIINNFKNIDNNKIIKNQELHKRYGSLSQDDLDDSFTIACQNGELDIIRYLLLSPDLERNANIHAGDDSGFISACNNNNLDVVKYLITSPELKEYANIHALDDLGLRLAFDFCNFDIVKYLLTSLELKDPANIHVEEDYLFKYSLKKKNFEMIKFLIFDANIEKTEQIEKILNLNKNYSEIENWFEMRDFNNQLQKELGQNKNINNKKIKV